MPAPSRLRLRDPVNVLMWRNATVFQHRTYPAGFAEDGQAAIELADQRAQFRPQHLAHVVFEI
jgi:hypothetical protein